MSQFFTQAFPVLHSGLGNLAAYLAAHVLLCLLPAFFIAGAMAALIPKEAITRFLGRNSSKVVSYPAAAAAGSLLAVCSCTIVPLFAGIYKKGAGLGPAITFLFFAPAANILALVYTGGVIGPDLALARFALSLAFGIGIGLIMAMIFRADDLANTQATDHVFGARDAEGMRRTPLLFLLAWIVLLLAGTLKLPFLTGTYLHMHVPLPGADAWQHVLDQAIPFDASKGEEGVTLQGSVLILLLLVIGVVAWRGFEHIQEGATTWTRLGLALIVATLLFAALSLQATPDGIRIGLTGKFVGVAIAFVALYRLARGLSDEEVQDWLWESWRFVKQIFPLLVGGVFIVGMIRAMIRPEWIEAVAGANTITGNLAGVAFGVFMYFPTLVEVPVARMFLDLGMHRGPLLAYLMSDPELSLQSILVISAILGKRKTAVYVGLVALFSAVAGYAYGAWIDGMPGIILAIAVTAFIALLSASLRVAERFSTSVKGV